MTDEAKPAWLRRLEHPASFPVVVLALASPFIAFTLPMPWRWIALVAILVALGVGVAWLVREPRRGAPG